MKTLFFSVMVLASVALAQPVNDACADALPIAATRGHVRNRSPAVALFGAALAPEAPLSCAPGAQSSVWYAFTPAEDGRYEFSTCPQSSYLATTPLKDFTMAVYSGPCGALAEVNGGCNDDWCGKQPRVVVELTANVTYRIQVARFDAAADNVDTVQVAVARTSGADNCASVPDLPLDTTVAVSTIEGEANDSQITAACYAGIGNLTTTPQSEGPRRDRVHRFTAPSTAAYSFRTGASNRAFDTVLYLTDGCVSASSPPHLYSGAQCLAAANRFVGTSSAQEELSCVPLNAGQQVYVWVDEGVEQTVPLAGGTVPLEVTRCQVEAEPNDTPATAAPLTCNLTGSIQSAGDVDFFSLGTPTAGARVFAMAEASTATSATAQLQLRVTTGTDTVEFDTADLDTPFGATSPGVAGTPLTNVPHFLRVSHDNVSNTLQPYHLYAVVQPGAATPEVEPNDTPNTATAGATNYFSGTTTAPSDTDFFAFEARAGDVVYLALDSVPARGPGNTSNHSLALWNAAGQLFFVNDNNVTVNVSASDGTLTSLLPVAPSEHLLYRVPESGTYWARVRREQATNPNADYLLSISINCGVGGGLVAPSLAALTPASGSSLGGELVTLTGAGFGPGSAVAFGSAGAEVASVSSTQLVVRTPVGAAGTVDVSVTNFGFAATTLSGAFTYVTSNAAPTVTSVTPAEGPTAGGQTITVRGQRFANTATVRFDVAGDVRAGTNVNVVNLTELTVTTPAHVDGAATVIVSNAANESGSLPDGFRFNAPPLLTSLTPASGLTSGGATVTLHGSNFRSGALVRFGTSAGTGVNVDPSGTFVTVVSPASASPGVVDVVLVNADGQQARRADGFRYLLPLPTLSAVAPARGPSSGGTLITLSGTNFFTSPTVLVNDVAATNVSRVSATQLTAVTPPGTPGIVTVAVANLDGQQAALMAAYAYDAAPSIASVTPARGPVGGGTRITIHGADFQPGAWVHIGGAPAVATTVVDANTLITTTPSGGAGAVDVEVTNVDAQRGVASAGFTYDAAPKLTELSPTSGSTSGGTVVTLKGTGFSFGAEVRFGSLPSSAVTVLSPWEVTAVAPAAAKNVVPVTLRNADGQSATLANAFAYVDAPGLTSVSPASGPARGGTVVRLNGSGFSASSVVHFGAAPSPQVTFVSATVLDAVTPAGMSNVDVRVTNPDGAVAMLDDAFTYQRVALTITGVTPNSGPESGGNDVTISGTGFSANAEVLVGAVPVVVVDRSGERLRVQMPPYSSSRVVGIEVRNDANEFVEASDSYRYLEAAGGGVAVGGDAPDAGTTPNQPTGCGCAGVEGSALVFAALGVLLGRRRR